MQTLDAAIAIDAPATRVWEIIADLEHYTLWNPFITHAAGRFAVGERLDITIQAPGMKPVRFSPRVLEHEPGSLVRWKGRWLVPGLFDGRHALIVDPVDARRSRFTTHEDVSGLLLPFLGRVMKASQEGFEQFCRALKERAEQPAGAARPEEAP